MRPVPSDPVCTFSRRKCAVSPGVDRRGGAPAQHGTPRREEDRPHAIRGSVHLLTVGGGGGTYLGDVTSTSLTRSAMLRMPSIGPRSIPLAVLSILVGTAYVLHVGRLKAPSVVNSYSSAGDTVAVMVTDPRDLVSCNQVVAEWMKWARHSPDRRFVILLTRKPAPREDFLIRSTRAPVEAKLVPGRFARAGSPSLFLLADLTPLRNVVGAPAMRALLGSVSRTAQSGEGGG